MNRVVQWQNSFLYLVDIPVKNDHADEEAANILLVLVDQLIKTLIVEN